MPNGRIVKPSLASLKSVLRPSVIGRSVLNVLFGQGVVYLISVVQITYLTSIFPPSSYGILAFCQTIATLSLVWTSYATNNTGVMALRAARDDAERSEVFSDHMSAQLMLLLVALIVLFIVLGFTFLHENWHIYAVVTASLLGTVLWPAWTMVAFERFKFLSVTNALIRIGPFFALLLFVRQPSQIFEAALCLFLPSLVILPGIVLPVRRTGVLAKLHLSIDRGLTVIRRDFGLAVSSWLNYMFTAYPILLAKFALAPEAFGLYAFADRFRALAASLIGVVALVFYSRFCAHLTGKGGLARFGQLSLVAIVGFASLIAVFLMVCAGWIIQIIGSEAYQPAFWAVRVLAASIPVLAFNFYLGYFIVPAYKLAKSHVIVVSAAMAAGCATIGLLPVSGPTQIAAIVLAVEVARAITSCIVIHRSGVRILSLSVPSG